MLMVVPGLFVVAIKSAAMLKLAVKLSGAMLCNATAKSSALVLGNIIGIGFIAALVGQGGGSLITPLLLYMELNPQQAAATGSVVMLITSSSKCSVEIFLRKNACQVWRCLLASGASCPLPLICGSQFCRFSGPYSVTCSYLDCSCGAAD